MTRLEVLRQGDGFRLACIVDGGSGGEGWMPQIIAVVGNGHDAESLADMVLREARERVLQVVEMAQAGDVPADVRSFSELHDHFDANMLGCAGVGSWFAARPLIGRGAPDREEAECAVMNCANNAVDDMIRRGGLPCRMPVPR